MPAGLTSFSIVSAIRNLQSESVLYRFIPDKLIATQQVTGFTLLHETQIFNRVFSVRVFLLKTCPVAKEFDSHTFTLFIWNEF